MNLTTRCPSCGTAFRVQPAQLSARGGKVRCGKCGGVFDGVKALLAEGAAQGEQLQEIDSEPSPQLGLFEAPNGYWANVLIDWSSTRNEIGHARYTLRPQVVKALRILGFD